MLMFHKTSYQKHVHAWAFLGILLLHAQPAASPGAVASLDDDIGGEVVQPATHTHPGCQAACHAKAVAQLLGPFPFLTIRAINSHRSEAPIRTHFLFADGPVALGASKIASHGCYHTIQLLPYHLPRPRDFSEDFSAVSPAQFGPQDLRRLHFDLFLMRLSQFL